MRRIFLLSAALFTGLLTASADITPYSWQRFDTYKIPGADGSGNNHPISSGFTGNGESPNNTQPVVGNIAVGGPLGSQGYFSGYSLRAGANSGANQGTKFEEPVPVGALTNTSLWGNFFQTNANWVVECWYLPAGNGANYAAPIFSTGLNRNNRSPNAQSGVMLVSMNTTNASILNGSTVGTAEPGNTYVRLQASCPPNVVDTNGNTMDFYIGPPILVKTPTNAAWMHFAVVRDDLAGTVAWYTNGVLVAATNSWRVYQTNVFSSPGFSGTQDSGYTHSLVDASGNVGVGLGGGAQTLRGYMAELRWSSFNPGQFSVNDLLTRRAAAGSATVSTAPAIVQDPQNITVYSGGSAPFRVVAATDTTITYQWLRGGVAIPGATTDTYVLANATAGDSSAQFNCRLTSSGGITTSAAAILTVVAPNASLAIGYSNAVVSEPSIVAYFPMDGSTGTNLINVVDHNHNATILGTGYLNGDSSKASGSQTLSLNSPNMGYFGGYALTNGYGYAEIQGDNPGFQFPSGKGTVEAVLYMDPSAKFVLSAEQPCWLSSVTVPGTFDYYQFRADFFGNIYYQSSVQTTPLVWIVPGGLVGKKTHVAITFDTTLNIMTCYANGVSLGTKVMAGLGNTPPDAFQPIWIGRRDLTPENGNNGGNTTANNTGYFYNMWRGSIDEVAIYGAALSANTISSHYYRLQNGTANNPASVAQISPSKSLYAGFQVQNLSVTAGGLAPFTYQWYSNNVILPGATSNSFPVTTLPVGSYSYTVKIQGAVGSAVTSAPVVLNVINPTGYASKVFGSSGGGPVAYWPLDEATGNVVFDWAGTHDGILTGGYQHDPANGPVAGSTGSLRMFGTNGLNDFSQAQVPYYPELNPISGQFTWEFWYRLDSDTASSCVMSSMYNVGNNKAGPSIYVGFGTTGFNQTTINNWTVVIGRFNNTNQGVGQNVNGSGVTVPMTNTWYHVAMVVDAQPGIASLTSLYINGSLEYTDGTGYSLDPNAGFNWNQNTIAPLILGNRNLGALPMFGALSEVAIYNYPLTASDITNHTAQIWTNTAFVTQSSGSTFSPTAAKVTGYITNGTSFVVTNVAYGPLANGNVLDAPGILQGTKISGVPANFNVTGSMFGNVLTVTATPSFPLSIGHKITGNNSAGNPVIIGYGTGTGGIGTYILSVGNQSTSVGTFAANAGGVGVYTLSVANPIAGAVTAYAGQQATEGVGSTFTINAGAVLGIPNSYQWQLNGTNLSPSLNFDGTAHYPRVGNQAGDSQGVYSPKLFITQLTTNDTGLYSLQVANPLNPGGLTNSIVFYLLVTNDLVKPYATAALVKSTMVDGRAMDDVGLPNVNGFNGTPAPLFLVEVKFSKRVDPLTATNPANYVLSGGVQVTNVVLANVVSDSKFGGAYQTVGLVTSGLQANTTYTLAVNNVKDEATVPNTMTNGQTFTLKTPPLSTGRAVYDYYYGISGGFDGVAAGTNAAFPYVPQATGGVTNFSSDAIAYNFSLNNNPAFTGQAANYVSTLSAWVTPTNTGYYQFFINADDKARLYFNQGGSDPAGAGYIGESYNGGAIFNETFAWGSFLLQAGHPYFLQAIQYQIGGGDYMRVGWRYLGTQDLPYDGSGVNGAWTVDITNLPPIEGKFLSAYLVGAPVIATQPQSLIVAPSTATTNLSVVVGSTGTGITNYQWYLNGSSQGGKTTATISFAPLGTGSYGTWTCAVDDGSGVTPTISSAALILPPTFTITPLAPNAAAPIGVPHNITVTSTASSGTTGYQWRFNGINLAKSANIANQNGQTLTINSMRSPDNVGNYDVIVNDGFHSVTSSVQNLTIAGNPAITATYGGSAINLTFPSQVGPQYVIQYKGALTNGAWTTLTTTNGTGSPITVPASVAPTGQRFYRIQMQ